MVAASHFPANSRFTRSFFVLLSPLCQKLLTTKGSGGNRLHTFDYGYVIKIEKVWAEKVYIFDLFLMFNIFRDDRSADILSTEVPAGRQIFTKEIKTPNSVQNRSIEPKLNKLDPLILLPYFSTKIQTGISPGSRWNPGIVPVFGSRGRFVDVTPKPSVFSLGRHCCTTYQLKK